MTGRKVFHEQERKRKQKTVRYSSTRADAGIGLDPVRMYGEAGQRYRDFGGAVWNNCGS